MNRLRLHVIACPSLRPELEMLAAEAKTAVAFRFLEAGLHQRSAKTLSEALQCAIDAETDVDAVAIGYGLCNRGVVGLTARDVPVVIPRAHDCIGMLLGSRRYLAQLRERPGTYFQSAGWLENSQTRIRQPDFTFGPDSNVTRRRLVERYGEENADYLFEQCEALTRHYDRLAYIATPVASSARWETVASEMAAVRNWTFERLEGDLGLLQRLLNAEWSSNEFLTLRPGECVVETFDERLIIAAPA